MANWRLLGVTQAGVREYYSMDPVTGEVTIRAQQDLEPHIEDNKTAQRDGTNGFTRSREMRKIASIPPLIAQIWSRQAGVPNIMHPHCRDLLQKKLKDPDNRLFLTAENTRFDLVRK